MIHGIHHTAISTGDIERALRFYRDLLGFAEVFSSAWEVGTEEVDRIMGLQTLSLTAHWRSIWRQRGDLEA